MENNSNKGISTIMFSEIMEEPDTVINTANEIKDSVLKASNIIKRAKFVYIVGSGTSYHAGIIMQIELLKAGIPAITVRAPELNYFITLYHENIAVILLSQSGESKDIIDSLNLCKKQQYPIIGVTNTRKSTLADNSDISIVTSAGEEKSLAATKSYIGQLIVSYLISSSIENEDKIDDSIKLCEGIANKIQEIINDNNLYKKLSNKLSGRIIFLGDGPLHAVAKEGALKFEETASLVTEAYPIGEYLHGPIQILKSNDTVIVLKGNDRQAYDRIIPRLMEHTSNIITIGNDDDCTIIVPADGNYSISAIYNVVPLQLLANFKTISLGLNPDKPTYLNKIVK
jgi:glucosamine--fructose-6-phosphate aminotransferase (isomerizing)